VTFVSLVTSPAVNATAARAASAFGVVDAAALLFYFI